MTETRIPASMVAGVSEGLRERILDGTGEVASTFGLADLTIARVARAAGVARPTVYRYFASRDELIAAFVLREEELFLMELSVAAQGAANTREALESILRRALELARKHPVLDRLIATEPEALLPFLTTGRGPVLAAAEPFVRELLDEWAPHLDVAIRDRGAEAATRLIVSYAIAAPHGDVATVAYELAELLGHGLVPRSRHKDPTA